MLADLLNKFSALRLPIPDQHGHWQGVLTLHGTPGEGEFEATKELLSYLARFSKTGAFACTEVQMQGQSGFDFITGEKNENLEIRITASNLHPGAWRVFAQLLAHCHQAEPYDDIVFEPLNGYMISPDSQLIMTQAYPDLFVQEIVPVTLPEDGLQGRNISMEITSSRELTADDVKEIREVVDDWGSLVFVGSFLEIDKTVDEPLLDQPNVFRMGKQAVCVQSQEFGGPPQAWSLLVNMVLSLYQRFDICQVEIE